LTLVFVLCSCGKEPLPTIVVKKNDDTYTPGKVQPVLDEWQKATFRYFYDGADPSTGMAYEGNERGTVIATGGSGFGVMALIVGAERGWITREQAAERIVKMFRFLDKAERFRGMWSHWYNPDGTAHPFGDQVKTGDIVESSYMAAGILTAYEYFNGNTAAEKEIRALSDSFWNTMNWRFYALPRGLQWLWYSLENRLALDVKGWNECWITYIMALAAPDPLNIPEDVYKTGWQSNGAIYHPNRYFYGYSLPFGENKGGPMFFAHYSFLGLNPSLIADQYANYWHQNVSHAMINRHYCITEAPASYKYDEKNWGLTACYGAKPPLWDYKARSPLNDDGVLAPTAALSNFPYTPFYSTQVLLNLATMPLVKGTYGFADAYCPSANTSEKKHLAIDQGPIVVMIENYRTGLIWNLFMKNERVKLGLKRAGVKDKPAYKQGFHLAVVNTLTLEYDMMRHPDRKLYELPFFTDTPGITSFTISSKAQDKTVVNKTVTASAGENVFSFDSDEIANGKQYSIRMITPDLKEYTVLTRLR